MQRWDLSSVGAFDRYKQSAKSSFPARRILSGRYIEREKGGKRGQIYFFVVVCCRGLPCPRHSTLLPIFFSIASIYRLLPVS